MLLSAFVWPPAVVWSLIIAGFCMIAIQKILEKRMIPYLVEARGLQHNSMRGQSAQRWLR